MMLVSIIVYQYMSIYVVSVVLIDKQLRSVKYEYDLKDLMYTFVKWKLSPTTKSTNEVQLAANAGVHSCFKIIGIFHM